GCSGKHAATLKHVEVLRGTPQIALGLDAFQLRGRARAPISGEVAEARRSVVERRKHPLCLGERTRAHRKARSITAPDTHLSVQWISLSTTQVNCIAIVINAHI